VRASPLKPATVLGSLSRPDSSWRPRIHVRQYDRCVIYGWDAEKAAQRRLGVPFDEARTVFLDLLAETFDDPGHSSDEQRFITIGCRVLHLMAPREPFQMQSSVNGCRVPLIPITRVFAHCVRAVQRGLIGARRRR
jgi:hypothetical protein